LLLLSLEESNQRTCEILTHDALSTPRAESFGGVNDEQCHRVLHAHRNFTPSSASALRTPPKISRARVLGCAFRCNVLRCGETMETLAPKIVGGVGGKASIAAFTFRCRLL
jgi:hypothetical protein